MFGKDMQLVLQSRYRQGLTDINGNPIEEFDKVTIRNHGNDVSDAQMRDDIVQALAVNMDISRQAAADCILFIDGEFWGCGPPSCSRP